MELIDIGLNLTHASFREDRDQVVARARKAGVEMILTGTSVPGSRRALELAQHYSLYATCGVHPHDAKNAGDLVDLFEILGRVLELAEVVFAHAFDVGLLRLFALLGRQRIGRLRHGRGREQEQ